MSVEQKNGTCIIKHPLIHADHETHVPQIREIVEKRVCKKCHSVITIQQETWGVDNGEPFVTFRIRCEKCDKFQTLAVSIRKYQELLNKKK